MDFRPEPKTAQEFDLKRAVKNGLLDKVKSLIDNSEGLQSLDDRRYYDYYLIIKALDNKQIAIAKLLVEYGFRVHKKSKSNTKRTILYAAVESSGTDFITVLLENGASLDILAPEFFNQTPFHLAIDKNRLSVIELFLSQLKDVKALDENNLLHYAIKKNKIEIVEQLIEKGLSMQEKNEKNLTPFCLAKRYDHFQILDYLLSNYIVENVEVDSYDDVAPMYIASTCGNTILIKKYIDLDVPIDRPLESSINSWPCLSVFAGFTLLHIAVRCIKLKAVEFLISKGANILVKNNDGSSPLHLAFEMKNTGLWKTWQDFDDNNAIIDLMLNAHLKFESNPVNKCGLSHFHIACSRDEPAIVDHFLKIGTSINQPIKPHNSHTQNCHFCKKFYPLHFAAKYRCKKTLEFLLKKGVDVERRDVDKRTALHIAATESCLDGVRLLLEYGADITSIDSFGDSPLHRAFDRKNYAVVDVLLSVQNVAQSNPTDEYGVSHFHIACTRNNVDAVKSFIENGVSVDNCVPIRSEKDNFYWSGYSPLHFAVSHNRTKIVNLLLDNGASVNSKNCQGSTPLHIICQYTNDIFREFIKTALYYLSRQGKIALDLKPTTDIKEVFEEYSYGFSDFTKRIQINWASNRTEHLKIIDSLLNYGSNVNCTNNCGHTPVLYAYALGTRLKRSLANDLDCSEHLWDQIIESLSKELRERKKVILNNFLRLDVNLDECYKNGSILHYFLSKNNKWADNETLQLFLKKGVNVNVKNAEMFSPLHQAVILGNENLISTLLEYGAAVDCIYPEDNSTPLLMAASKISNLKLIEVVRIFIDQGANVHARQLNGKTALHNIASRFDVDYSNKTVISILIKAGADVNSRDSKGRTPLQIAFSRLNEDTIEDLLLYGADINVKDSKGRTVCSYLYNKHLKNLPTRDRGSFSYEINCIVDSLQYHVITMNVIGLPVSQKVMASRVNSIPGNDSKKRLLTDKCEREVRALRDKKINANCTLYDVIFKDENTLSQLVKNRTFTCLQQSASFEKKYCNYGHLIQLKYLTGKVRANLLPTAKFVLYNLIDLNLPDVCAENIFSNFSNVELKESIDVVANLLDLDVKSSDEMQLRYRRRDNKRQRIY